MVRHPYFDLWLHSDAELAEHLGAEVLRRVALHEWNLGFVERLTLADGRNLIYKVQRGPSREAEFYRRAASPLLCGWEILDETFLTSGHPAMLFEDIGVAPLIEGEPTANEVLRLGADLATAIREIRGVGRDIALFDLGGVDAWRALAQAAFDQAARLIGPRELRRGAEALTVLDRWARSAPVLAAVDTEPGLVHGDLYGGNVFLTAGGPKLIDWQRPWWGPAELDLVKLYRSTGVPTRDHLHPVWPALVTFVTMAWQLQIEEHWIPGMKPATAIVDQAAESIAKDAAS